MNQGKPEEAGAMYEKLEAEISAGYLKFSIKNTEKLKAIFHSQRA